MHAVVCPCAQRRAVICETTMGFIVVYACVSSSVLVFTWINCRYRIILLKLIGGNFHTQWHGFKQAGGFASCTIHGPCCWCCCCWVSNCCGDRFRYPHNNAYGQSSSVHSLSHLAIVASDGGGGGGAQWLRKQLRCFYIARRPHDALNWSERKRT